MKHALGIRLSFEEKITLEYRPLSFAGKLYGAILFLGGLFLMYAVVHEVIHHAQNLGAIAPGFMNHLNTFLCGYAVCSTGEWIFSFCLWFGFALVSVLVACAGIALFLAHRSSVFAKGGALTLKEFSGVITRTYSPKDIRYIVVSRRPMVMVFGAGLGGGVRASQVGFRYVIVLGLTGKKKGRILALYQTEEEAENVLEALLGRCTPTGQHFSTVFIDTFAGSQMKYVGDKAELYDILYKVWEKEVEHLFPSGHSYTESWEAVPYSIEAKVDMMEIAERVDWSEKKVRAVIELLAQDAVARVVA